MPIGIMGSESLGLLDWEFKAILQQGTRKNEYTCLCCFFSRTTLKHRPLGSLKQP